MLFFLILAANYIYNFNIRKANKNRSGQPVTRRSMFVSEEISHRNVIYLDDLAKQYAIS